MSRTTLCILTAAVLVALSVGLMVVRYQVLGDEVKVPTGPGTWKVTLVVHGRSTGTTRLQTLTPLDFGRQHISHEAYRSDELEDKASDARHPERRQVLWLKRPGVADGSFRANYEFRCTLDPHRPTASMTKLARMLYAPPRPGEHLDVESHAGTDNEPVAARARELTARLDRQAEEAQTLFHFVMKEIANEPNVGGPGDGAAECLQRGRGDSGAKSRLLTALLRNRGVPARMVTGLRLTRGEHQAHSWVEAWVNDHWLPMCPSHQHYGRVPASYLIFGFGDLPIVRGRQARDLDYAFLVERTAADEATAMERASTGKRLLRSLSLYMLPPTEQRLVEFLLLLPVAALIVCVYRNIIGLHSFGTFAPALVGLAFRDLRSLPGILVFVSILLVGWLMRRALDYYHLLQVPRVACMLTLVVIMLLSIIVAANFRELAATRYIPLFPMVILTGMIERFWTLETEDSTAASFKTLLSTMLIAATIALVLSLSAVANHMFRYPETLGLVMSAQLLIGRYTGYRLTELFRFRDFLRQRPLSVVGE
jgi:transglutaminase-like putative cysteine protease